MARALWNGKIIAESETYELVENNIYFPPNALNTQYLKPSDTTSICGWKGTANYYTLTIDGIENKDAAWYYRDPKPEARQIKDHVAFWRGVVVEK